MSQAQELERQEVEKQEIKQSSDPFSLSNVVSSYKFSPLKTVVYGVPGVGKTTFASTWERPLLLRTEDGASALDIPTFPRVVQNIAEFRSALNVVLKEKHYLKTLIIDSLDWLEPLVWEEVCREAEPSRKNIEDFGYGKGYVLVDDKWRNIQARLDMIRKRRDMHIVAIAHASATIFDPPDQDPYMKYGIKLHKRGAALWTEWAEMLLFLNYQINVATAQGSGKGKASGNVDRVIYTTERPAYLAKSRWPLPDKIFIGQDPTWRNFHNELNKATKGVYQGEGKC